MEDNPNFLKKLNIKDLRKLHNLLDSNHEYLESSEKKEKKRLFLTVAAPSAFFATHADSFKALASGIYSFDYTLLLLDNYFLIPATVAGVLILYRGVDIWENKVHKEVTLDMRALVIDAIEQKDKRKPFQKSDLPAPQV